jgi:hypothetical protein
VGTVVTVSYEKGALTVKKPGASKVSGTFSATGKTLGGYPLAEGAEIMDVSKEGAWCILYPSRLAGARLDAGKVAYYTLNENQEIAQLILHDVTGDMYSYGMVTDAREIKTPAAEGGSASSSGSYESIINGTAGTLHTTNSMYKIGSGPAIFYYKNGQISGMKNLTPVSIEELSALSAVSANQTYRIADTVQVYLSAKNNMFFLTDLSAITTQDYTLSGYYETIYPAGGQIRIILAEKKILPQ